jgi:hypothetical protein
MVMTDKELIFKLINNQMMVDIPEKPQGTAFVGVAYPTNIIRAFGLLPDSQPEKEITVEFKQVNYDYISKYYMETELELVDINELNIPIFRIKN